MHLRSLGREMSTAPQKREPKGRCATFEIMKAQGIKGVRLITDETENRRYVQIDLVTLAKEPEAVDEYLDGLIAQERRNEPGIPHGQVMRALYKRAGKKRATASNGCAVRQGS